MQLLNSCSNSFIIHITHNRGDAAGFSSCETSFYGQVNAFYRVRPWTLCDQALANETF